MFCVFVASDKQVVVSEYRYHLTYYMSALLQGMAAKLAVLLFEVFYCRWSFFLSLSFGSTVFQHN